MQEQAKYQVSLYHSKVSGWQAWNEWKEVDLKEG